MFLLYCVDPFCSSAIAMNKASMGSLWCREGEICRQTRTSGQLKATQSPRHMGSHPNHTWVKPCCMSLKFSSYYAAITVWYSANWQHLWQKKTHQLWNTRCARGRPVLPRALHLPSCSRSGPAIISNFQVPRGEWAEVVILVVPFQSYMFFYFYFLFVLNLTLVQYKRLIEYETAFGF